jgi:hypothetical protein
MRECTKTKTIGYMFIDPQNKISPWLDPKLVHLPEIIRVFELSRSSINKIIPGAAG